MRICIIAVDLPNPISDKVGGACEKLIYYIIKELSKIHEIHVIVNEKKLKLQPDELKSSVCFHGFGGATRYISKLREYLHFISYLKRLDAQYNFDIFHSFSYPFALQILLLSKLKRKPVFFSELTHLTWMHPRKGFSSNANFWINIFPAIQFGTKTIVPSSFIKERITQSIKCLQKKIVVIPYGLPYPPRIVNNHGFREKNNISKSRPILTFIGRLVPYKGIHNIIESVRILKKNFPEILLIVAGPKSGDFVSYSDSKNSYYRYLQSLTKNLDIVDNVMFTGFLNIDELYELLSDTTVFVFPSIEEAFGLVLIEALSMGLPIIAANLPPMTEIIDAISGRFVTTDSPDQIAEQVSILLYNPRLLKEISVHSIQVFHDKYELSHMINELVKLYNLFQ